MGATDRASAWARKHSWSAVLSAAVVACAAGVLLSLLVGDVSIHAGTVYDAVFHHDSANVDHLLVCDRRLPRAVADLLVGALWPSRGP